MKYFKLMVLLCAMTLWSSISFAVPKTLIIALGTEPDKGFDPILGWGKYNEPLFQSTLIKRNSKLELVSELANTWTLSKDKLSWVVNLKPNLKFSDGSTLDATDVKFTFELAAKSASEQDLTMLKSVQITDPKTLVFHLTHPDINFVDIFATLGIVPSDSYNTDYGNHPISSGPYQLVRWDKGQQLIATINPYYQHVESELGDHFQELIILFTSEASRFAQIQTDILDVAAIPPRYAKQIPNTYKLWRVTSVDSRGIVWPMTKPETVSTKTFGNAVSHDTAIRHAVNLIVDRKLLVNQLLDGFARPAYSIADGLPWGNPVKENTLSKKQRYQKAQALLDKSGWQLMQGVRYKQQGKNLIAAHMTLYYLAGDSIREQLSLAVAQMVKPLGIILQPKAASWEVIAQHMFTQPVLMGYGSLSASEVYFTHHSRYAGQDFFNSGYYQNSQVDKLLDQARNASTWDKSLPYWQAALNVIDADQPWTWLVNLEHLYVSKPCLDLGHPGIEPHGHGWTLLNNIRNWRWICR